MSGLDPAAGTTAPAGAGPGGLEPEERPKPITPPWADAPAPEPRPTLAYRLTSSPLVLSAAALVLSLIVGGLLISLLSGDGLELRPSGIIGSLVGAVLVTAGWIFFKKRSTV